MSRLLYRLRLVWAVLRSRTALVVTLDGRTHLRVLGDVAPGEMEGAAELIAFAADDEWRRR